MQHICLVRIILTLSSFLEVSAIPSGGGINESQRSSEGDNIIKGGRKPKGSKLTNATVTGIGIYSAEQLAKLSVKFAKGNFTYLSNLTNDDWFDEWNNWREAEGLLCRKDLDCSWIDTKMDCVDYELQFTPSVSSIMIDQLLQNFGFCIRKMLISHITDINNFNLVK